MEFFLCLCSAVVPQCYWMRQGAYNVNLKQQLEYQLNQLEGETAQKITDYDPMPMVYELDLQLINLFMLLYNIVQRIMLYLTHFLRY